ncbi:MULTISPECIES: hypothetical protein [Photorhabdus]|nr:MULTISPECIES: hypothetical protein [Photorhabdus]
MTKIVERKISHGMTFLVTDGGMNHHLSASCIRKFGAINKKKLSCNHW